MLSVSLVKFKNEALKKLHFKSIFKCFKKEKIDKSPDLPDSPIDCCVELNRKSDGSLNGDIQS